MDLWLASTKDDGVCETSSNSWSVPGIYFSSIIFFQGDCLRRFFSALSVGLVLQHGHGIADVTNDNANYVAELRKQEREDITGKAQLALRLIAFGVSVTNKCTFKWSISVYQNLIMEIMKDSFFNYSNNSITRFFSISTSCLTSRKLQIGRKESQNL